MTIDMTDHTPHTVTLDKMRGEIDARPNMLQLYKTDFSKHDTEELQPEAIGIRRALWAIRQTGSWLIKLDAPPSAHPPSHTTTSWVNAFQNTSHEHGTLPHQWFFLHPARGEVKAITFEAAQSIAKSNDIQTDHAWLKENTK
jgi:hypothetical protein